MPSKGSCLTADPFHHAPISAECVDIVMKQFEARAIEVRGQPAPSHRYPHTSGHSLTEWTGGRLDARGPSIFGMTWTFAIELAEELNVLQLDR